MAFSVLSPSDVTWLWHASKVSSLPLRLSYVREQWGKWRQKIWHAGCPSGFHAVNKRACSLEGGLSDCFLCCSRYCRARRSAALCVRQQGTCSHSSQVVVFWGNKWNAASNKGEAWWQWCLIPEIVLCFLCLLCVPEWNILLLISSTKGSVRKQAIWWWMVVVKLDGCQVS